MPGVHAALRSGGEGAAPGTAPGIDAVADASLGAAVAPGGRLAAQPDFFGLLLVHELEGGQWLPVTANPTTPVWEAAVKMPSGGVRVVIVNPSPRSTAEITIQAPGYAGPASVQRLTGPSLVATSGVTLGGAGVGGDGRWRPLPDAPLTSQAGSVRVDIPAATAALVTMAPPHQVADRGGRPSAPKSQMTVLAIVKASLVIGDASRMSSTG